MNIEFLASRTLDVTTDNLVTVTVVDAVTGTPVSNATVSMTLEDSSGNVIAGQAFPASLPFLASAPATDYFGFLANGTYQGTLQDTLQIVAGQRYVLVINVLAPGSRVKTIHRRLAAQWPES